MATLASRGTLASYEFLRARLTDVRGNEIAGLLAPVAQDLGCTLGQLALAWCVKNPRVSTVITGATSVAQVSENMKALAVVPKLTAEVLERIDPRSERALFGMAVVASNTRKPDLAEDYFLRTLEAARDLRIATWARIYLGRLYDLKGRRQEALEQYRAASLTASSYPEALRAVQVGLQRPSGSKP